MCRDLLPSCRRLPKCRLQFRSHLRHDSDPCNAIASARWPVPLLAAVKAMTAISTRAAKLSLGATVVFLVYCLHVIEPQLDSRFHLGASGKMAASHIENWQLKM